MGSDGNFTIHMGFVLAGVLPDTCVYLSLDDFQKGHIPLTPTTVGDESLFIVPQSMSERVRQTQTQLPTHPPSTNGAGQPWKNTNDTTCSTADFPEPSFLELAAATANISGDSYQPSLIASGTPPAASDTVRPVIRTVIRDDRHLNR